MGLLLGMELFFLSLRSTPHPRHNNVATADIIVRSQYSYAVSGADHLDGRPDDQVVDPDSAARADFEDVMCTNSDAAMPPGLTDPVNLGQFPAWRPVP